MTGADPPPARTAHRPEVWVNYATSEDGRIAYAGGRRARLSSEADLQRVQDMRSVADGILVGVGTVIADDPSLRVHWEMLGRPPGTPPARVVVDATGRTPATARVLDGTAPTVIGTSERSTRKFPDGVEVIVAGRDEVDLGLLFERLYDRGMRRLMVEGGSEILASVFRGRLFDRCTVYHAPVVIGGRTAPTVATGPETPSEREAVGLRLVALERLGDGYLATFVPR
jgi:2,5-diamino-6-(ribosylamino)-4(3H)-pyrimidinone 5'-phosphate reductase